MTITCKQFPNPLTVYDDRSRFATFAVAWRPQQNAAEQAAQLRVELEKMASNQSRTMPPLHSSFATGAGTECLISSLPTDGIAAWAQSVQQTMLAYRQSYSHPVVTAVGPAAAARAAAQLQAKLGRHDTSQAAPTSTMVQNRQQGFEQTLITGADPSPAVGHAATFVAISALLAGPEENLQTRLRSVGSQAVVSLSRGMAGRVPNILWTVVSPAEQSMQALEDVTAAAVYLARQTLADPDRVVTFAEANLRRSWLSPQELAQGMAEYEVRGWGGELVREPESAFDGIRRHLAAAFTGLLKPIADVLGKTITLEH